MDGSDLAYDRDTIEENRCPSCHENPFFDVEEYCHACGFTNLSYQNKEKSNE